MRTNVVFRERTHEGAVASRVAPYDELRRTVLGCLLFEDMFYEDGLSVADRIAAVASKVEFSQVLSLAVEARKKHGLRHVPLWLCVAALNHPKRNDSLAATIAAVCNRADLPGELLSLYWKTKKKPLANALKKGLRNALRSFDRYKLSKYANRPAAIRPRDVLFLTHPKPKDEEQAALWKELADDSLTAPDTWEAALSAGADKGETFTRLLSEQKIGGLAILRNLRNMSESGVSKELAINELIRVAPNSGILPFQFIAAARAVPNWEDGIEKAMLLSAETLPKLPGHTLLLVDVSGSMQDKMSGKSELRRIDAACALAMLAREVCEKVTICRFDTGTEVVPSRRGFALRDAIGAPRGGTDAHQAVVKGSSFAYQNGQLDRIIMFTDEQSQTRLPNLSQVTGYVMNVAAYKNGIAWGPWTSISGFSESVLSFVSEAEKAA